MKKENSTIQTKNEAATEATASSKSTLNEKNVPISFDSGWSPIEDTSLILNYCVAVTIGSRKLNQDEFIVPILFPVRFCESGWRVCFESVAI